MTLVAAGHLARRRRAQCDWARSGGCGGVRGAGRRRAFRRVHLCVCLLDHR
ncbi:hypothetical protein ACP4OV_029397 [Aristida adscensionis]